MFHVKQSAAMPSIAAAPSTTIRMAAAKPNDANRVEVPTSGHSLPNSPNSPQTTLGTERFFSVLADAAGAACSVSEGASGAAAAREAAAAWAAAALSAPSAAEAPFADASPCAASAALIRMSAGCPAGMPEPPSSTNARILAPFITERVAVAMLGGIFSSASAMAAGTSTSASPSALECMARTSSAWRASASICSCCCHSFA